MGSQAYHVFHDWANINQKLLATEVLGVNDKLNEILVRPKYKSIEAVKRHWPFVKRLLMIYDSSPVSEFLPRYFEPELIDIFEYLYSTSINEGCSCHKFLIILEMNFPVPGIFAYQMQFFRK